jgi:F-type H+-transporting ATPase subunit delta
MKKASLSVARRYARALLDVALEKGGAERVAASLAGAVQLLADQAELRRVLTHPALSVEKKKKIAEAVWKAEPDPLFGRLIALLVDRDRMALLPGIHQSFVDLWNQQRGIVSAEAISATPLDAAQQKALTAAATTLAGRTVDLTASVDDGLLGGVVLRMDGRTYDGSIRARLRALRTRLAPDAASSSSNPRV